MTIIKIEPEWNNAHCYLDDVDYNLWGWAALPAEFATVWTEHAPFVHIVTNDAGEIVEMTPCAEILPEPEPEPAPTDGAQITNAIEEGLTND